MSRPITGPGIRSHVEAALGIHEVDNQLMRKYIHAQHALSGTLSEMTKVIKEFDDGQALAAWRKAKIALEKALMDDIEPMLDLNDTQTISD